jgi:hypothetical protein
MNFFNNRKRLAAGTGTDGTCTSLTNFFRIKGSVACKIRIFLDRSVPVKDPLLITPVKTYFRLTGLEGINFNFDLGKMLGLWNSFFLPNRLREFCFKYFFNQLALNTRLSHFLQGHSRNCGNCVANGIAQVQEESFAHLFLDCPVTTQIHNFMLGSYLPEFNITTGNKRILFFTGSIADGSYANSTIFLLFGLVTQYIIWEAKLQKRRLSSATANIEFQYIFYGIGKNNRDFSDKLLQTFGNGNRYWNQIFGERDV